MEYVYVFVILALLFLCAKHITRVQDTHLDPKYIPNRQDVDGYRATRFRYWGFWLLIGFILLIASFFVFLSILMYENSIALAVFTMIGSVILYGMSVWMILSSREFYLTIDDKGIRGVCILSNEIETKEHSVGTFDITWQKIEKIKLTTVRWGNSSADALAIYYNKYLDDPDMVILLNFISTLKVIDAIKFHSCRNNKPNIISR